MEITTILIVLLGTSILFQELNAARILALFPYNSKSHFYMFETLVKELAGRGHEVVVLSHSPQKKPIPNYTDINVDGTLPEIIDCMPMDLIEECNAFYLATLIWAEQVDMCRLVLNHTNVKLLLESEQKFDLIITEVFAADCFLGFVHKFKVPFIGLITNIAFPWANHRVGNPDHPAYISNYFLPYTDRMTFVQRLVNTVYGVLIKWGYHYYSDLPAYDIARQHFGDDLPPLWDIAQNVSLLLVNTHFSFNQPRPTVPAFIEVGGLHIKTAQKLPKDLEKFMNESRNGVILFSLGSMVRSETISEDKLAAILAAFSELPQRVLWRCNCTEIKNIPKNVKVSAWLPQRDILEHPNIRAFITHGGLMGTQEAVYAGVPLVAIPMFGDQFLNVENYVSNGIAVKLDYSNITKENVLKALRAVLNDSRYRDNAKRLSLYFRDRPQSALDTAVFWTEYVIRHGGAPHLRTAAVDLYWYQYLLLDVIATLFAVFLIISIIMYLITRKVLSIFKDMFIFYWNTYHSLPSNSKKHL